MESLIAILQLFLNYCGWNLFVYRSVNKTVSVLFVPSSRFMSPSREMCFANSDPTFRCVREYVFELDPLYAILIHRENDSTNNTNRILAVCQGARGGWKEFFDYLFYKALSFDSLQSLMGLFFVSVL